MHIYQLGSDQDINRDMPSYAIESNGYILQR